MSFFEKKKRKRKTSRRRTVSRDLVKSLLIAKSEKRRGGIIEGKKMTTFCRAGARDHFSDATRSAKKPVANEPGARYRAARLLLE